MLLAAVAVLGLGCVTGEDLRAVAGSLDRLDQKQVVTAGDVEEAQAEIEEVARLVEERTRGVVNGISQGAEGGIVGILAALGLNLYRNRTRKRDLGRVVSGGEPPAAG